MEKLNQVLSLIFYLIWIPLGILLIAGVVFLIVANPLAGIQQALGSLQGGFGQSAPAGGFPSQEMIRQFMEQGRPPADGFGSPGQQR